jgi:hypothetical protein
VLLRGLICGYDQTLAPGHDRTSLCHRSGPGKAEGERSDARRVRSIKIVSRTSLFAIGCYCSESGQCVEIRMKGVMAILALGAIKEVCGRPWHMLSTLGT